MIRAFLFFALAYTLHAAPPSTLHYVGSGRSMGPWLSHGEILNSIPVEYADLSAGYVAAFYVPELSETVAHRLVRLEADGWVTKGDANDSEDTWRITPANYLALVLKIGGDTNSPQARVMGQLLKDVYVINLHAGESSLLRGAIYSQPPRTPVRSVPEPGATFGMLAIGLGILLGIARWWQSR
jgi:hypothetical protein